MRERKSMPFFQTGSSFLLVIAVVVSLSLFGVLSLSGSVRERDLARAVADRDAAYYTAVSEVQERLPALSDEVGHAGEGVLPEMEGVDIRMEDGLVRALWTVPVSEKQDLKAEAVLDEKGTVLDVSWHTAPAGIWEEEDSGFTLFQTGG